MFELLKLKRPSTDKKRVFELKVTGWLGNFFANRDWASFTYPLPFCFIIFYWIGLGIPEVLPEIRVHENQHVIQCQDELFLVAWVKYLWQMVKNFKIKSLFKIGLSEAMYNDYMANKYEKEAYEVENIAKQEGFPDWAKTS